MSAAVVASGFVTREATTRDSPPSSVKSESSPSIPVSITATPTPSPVASDQLCGASTENGYAVSRCDGSRLRGGRTLEIRVEYVRALTLTRAIRPSPASCFCALGASRAATPLMIGSVPVTSPPAARTIAPPSAGETPPRSCTMCVAPPDAAWAGTANVRKVKSRRKARRTKLRVDGS